MKCSPMFLLIVNYKNMELTMSRDELVRGFELLNSIEQQVMILYLRGYRIGEIASQVDRSPRMVEATIRAAIAHLQTVRETVRQA
mgnify:FL=1